MILCTIDGNAVSKMGISKNLRTISNGERGSPAPACAGVKRLEGRHRCDETLISMLSMSSASNENVLPIVSTKPVNMVSLKLSVNEVGLLDK
jgi:hypothetical protein